MCPNCQSESVTGGSVEIDGEGAMQECVCDSCGAQWDDIYIKTCIANLEVID
jgi:hypothetical protein